MFNLNVHIHTITIKNKGDGKNKGTKYYNLVIYKRRKPNFYYY